MRVSVSYISSIRPESLNRFHPRDHKSRKQVRSSSPFYGTDRLVGNGLLSPQLWWIIASNQLLETWSLRLGKRSFATRQFSANAQVVSASLFSIPCIFTQKRWRYRPLIAKNIRFAFTSIIILFQVFETKNELSLPRILVFYISSVSCYMKTTKRNWITMYICKPYFTSIIRSPLYYQKWWRIT